jgi:hypothetical protein
LTEVLAKTGDTMAGGFMRLLLVMAVLALSACATTPESKAKWAGALGVISKAGYDSADAANERLAAAKPLKPTGTNMSSSTDDAQANLNVDFKCKSDCQAAGYAANLCHKQCSY